MPLLENRLSQQHKIWSRNTRSFKLSYGENPKSLISPGLELVPGRDTRTDRQTYGQNYGGY